MSLTPGQQAAYDKAMLTLTRHAGSRQMALLGYAGTGKTYTTQRIADALVECGYSLLAITHTHKALSVLGASLNGAVQCATIYSALGWMTDERSGEIRRTGRHRLHGYDAIIVDEASMVDKAMYEDLVALTEQAGTPILWVGDPAQIPPVGEASSPVFERVQHQARLEEIVRQAEGSPIIQASKYLRWCVEQNTLPDISEIEEIADTDGRLSVVRGGLPAIADYLIDARQHGLDARAIAFHRRLEDRIGDICAARYHPPGAPRLVEGDPITMSARCGDKISNGTEMTVTSSGEMLTQHGPLGIDCQRATARVDGTDIVHELIVPQDSHAHQTAIKRVRAKRDSERRRARTLKDAGERSQAALAADDAGILAQEIADTYASVRYTYASTAHKAQGSTYDVAIVSWDDILSAGPEQAARLLYVSCTRPSKYLVVVTDKTAGEAL